MSQIRTAGVTLAARDGRAALVDPAGVEIIALTRMQRLVWEALDDNQTAASLAHYVRANGEDTGANDVDEDVARFLVELEDQGLVTKAVSPGALSRAANSAEVIAQGLRQAVGGDPALWIEISSGSMRPVLRSGNRVRIAAADRPRWGEVWAYCHQTGFVLVHRCKGRRRDGFLFQGDAERRSMAFVPRDRLIGRAVAVEHGRSSRPLGRAERWTRGVWRQVAHELRRVARRLSGRVRRPNEP
jgi:Coenzyme PQQ synthesis protein D (PqqD)